MARGRLVIVVLVALICVQVMPVGASELPSEPDSAGGTTAEDGTGSDDITLTNQRLGIPLSSTPGWTNNIWLWRKGRRAFTLAIPKKTDNDATGGYNRPVTVDQDRTVVTAYDLDTLREVAQVKLDRPYATQDLAIATQDASQARHAAVDEDGGRLFVPYSHLGGADVSQKALRAMEDGGRCLVTGGPVFLAKVSNFKCVVGLFVLNASSLDVVRRIPLGQLSVDGGLLLAPTLTAMSYSPPVDGESGKVYLYVREGDTRPLGDAQGTLNYVVQVDPTAGRVDWVVRAESCRGVRQPKTIQETNDTTGSNALAEISDSKRRLNEAVVFRAGPAGARSVWVGCHLPNQTAAVVRIPLDEHGFPASTPYSPGDPGLVAGKALSEGPGSIDRSDVARPSSAGPQETFPGPKNVREIIADVASERVLLKVVDGSPVAEVWWVFDGRKGAFVGTIGIGRYDPLQTVSGLDPSTGRFYVLAPPQSGNATAAGGLFVIDVRRTPVPQALVFPEFSALLNAGPTNGAYNAIPIEVDYGDGATNVPRRLFVRRGDIVGIGEGDVKEQKGGLWSPYYYDIVEDGLPVTVDPVVDLFAGRSLDLDEIAGVTQANFDGAARGFAARTLFVGGVDAVGRAGPADATMATTVVPDFAGPDLAPCSRANRQVVLGFVGPRDAAVVDGNGSRGGAEPLVVDSGTRGDSEVPLARCAPEFRNQSQDASLRALGTIGKLDWDKIWSTGLFSRPPVGEPTAPWQFGDGDVSCVSSDEDPQDSFGDPVTGVFASKVECGEEEASGYGYARGVGVEDLNVSEAVSKFRIYRDPARGIVSRVESIARGIDVGGVIRIDSVRGVAESWANGRGQFVADADRDAGYDANCDFERTAGTCFSTSIFGVHTPVYSCGPCGDEQALTEGLSKALGANGRVRLRDPDETLRKGAPNGYIAAIQKPAYERFGDVVLNDDLLQTVVPVLEIIRYTSPGIGLGTIQPARRGLQVYQFAGVEVSSSYGIQCLLVYDAAANTCDAGPQGAGGLKVALTDADGKPLAGGAFEVRRDVDGDGALGLVDELISDGACVTAEDGTGTCSFEGLVPGGYVVVQKAAPAGYAVNSEPFVTQVDAGGVSTVTFVNTSNVSTVALTVQDEAGKPVSGAVFAVYADADSDGKIAGDAQPAATCTSGPDGTCSMSVPTGAYVLVQQSAPAGLEPIEPVAFVLTSGGQTAAVGVVNYPPELPAGPAAASPAVTYDTPAYTPTVATAPLEDLPVDDGGSAVQAPSLPEQAGGTIVRVIAAPGDALRLLTRDPKQAAAWTASLLLFALAALAIQRRRQATQLIGG